MNLNEQAVALFGIHFCRKVELELEAEAHAHYARTAMRSHDRAAADVIRALLQEVEGYRAENKWLTEMLRRQARGTK